MRGRGAFDDEEELEQQKSGGDAEFTLGAGTLALVLCGLVVVCGICFGLGYLAGRRGAVSQATVQQPADTQASPQAGDPQLKPSATTPSPAAAPEQAAASSESTSLPAQAKLPEPTSAKADPDSSIQNAKQPTPPQPTHPPLQAASPEPPPRLRTLPQPTLRYSPSPSEGESQPPVTSPPLRLGAGLWVQVAAVSHVEDAQVLTAALRKRGYIVTPRREADNLIHVRIGPFGNRDEANHWSMKLLDDGYNAEVQ